MMTKHIFQVFYCFAFPAPHRYPHAVAPCLIQSPGSSSNLKMALTKLLVAMALLIAIIAHWYRVIGELDKEMAHLNSTSGRCDPDLLIFNRVPKVGSQTIQNLIGILRVRNGFNAFTSIEDM